MKEAEQRLLDTQETKAYLGSAGDKRFAELLRPILLGEHADDERIAGLQTPGGCGALRLGVRADRDGQSERARVGRHADLAQPPADHPRGRARDRSNILITSAAQGAIRFEDMMEALRTARAGRRRLLHGCCHNPTGADLERRPVARGRATSSSSAGCIPFVDIAYQGFGRGLDEDACGRALACSTPATKSIIAQSCDKNFSVYRDRVGSLFVKTGSTRGDGDGDGPRVPARARDVVDAARPWRGLRSHIILDDRRASRALAGRARRDARPHQFGAPADRRGRSAAGLHRRAVRHVLDASAVARSRCSKLREDHAIYMADSGRFNVVGMGDEQIDRFIAAVVEALDA